MKTTLFKITVCLAILLTILFLYKSHIQTYPFRGYETRVVIIGEKEYKLYVADTEEKQRRGLSGIRKLGSNEGMIFEFLQKGKYQFWMKDMYFDLDFIFLDGNQVVDVIEDVKATSYPKVYQGKLKYNRVIELPTSSQVNFSFLRRIDI